MASKVFDAKIEGFKNIEKVFASVRTRAETGSIRALQKATFLLHRTAVKLVQENTDGTVVKRYSPTRFAVASNAGDPPNTDTGRLVQSIQFDIDSDGFSSRVGSNLKYAFWLEFGTEHMDSRPWLSTALELTSDKIAKIFDDSMKKAFK